MASLWPLSKKADPVKLIKQKLPRHVAITIDTTDEDSFGLGVSTIKNLIEFQTTLGIPVLTFNILPSRGEQDSEALSLLFDEIGDWPFVFSQHIKISVLGRWYDLREPVVDRIKDVIGKTKDHTDFTVHFGVNYDGQEELVDAVSRIARQVRAQKVDPERIDKALVKSSLDTAYLEAPGLIITTGKTFSLRSFMIWDAAYAKIYFSNVSWSQFKRGHLLKALVFHQNTKDEGLNGTNRTP